MGSRGGSGDRGASVAARICRERARATSSYRALEQAYREEPHRGARNRAVDFRWSERAYNAALAKYHTISHHLAVLGDADGYRLRG